MAGNEMTDGCMVGHVRRVLSLVIVVGFVLPVPVAGAQESTSSTTAASDPTTTSSGGDASNADHEQLPPATLDPLPPEDELPPPPPDSPPPVAPAGADDAGRARAALELRAAQSALKKARATERTLARKLLPFGRTLSARKAWMDSLARQDREVADQLVGARSKVRRMSIAGYMHGGEAQPMDYLLRSKDPIDLERRRTIVETATEARNAAVKGYAVAQRGSSERLEVAVAAVDNAQAAYDILAAELDAASAIAGILAFEVEDKKQLLDHANASGLVGATDVPRLFYDAYRQAAATLAKRAPQCRVPWTAIAAIGKIESNHGRYRGAQFALNGDVYPRILGVPLDGSRSALIRDTDAGILDTDLEFDRAVGPMQFIPSTWARIAQDGNGDKVSDPNNAYDAALGTAAYLCRAVLSGGLDTDEGLRPAYFSYNHSVAYVDAVLAWHHTYSGDVPAPVPAPAST
ncbi:MAG TPA: lytic transglycosylase domain-containing protein [Acidimicrobiales bacterium]|nr:lytic transglycosylase domain-containing protein [Acidimicrobiales bacterium]